MKTYLSLFAISVLVTISSCKKEDTVSQETGSTDPLETHWYPKKLSFLATENGDTTDYWETTEYLYLSMQIKSDKIVLWEHEIINQMPVQNGAIPLPGVNYTRVLDTIYGVDPNYPNRTADFHYEMYQNNDSLKTVTADVFTTSSGTVVESYTNIYSRDF